MGKLALGAVCLVGGMVIGFGIALASGDAWWFLGLAHQWERPPGDAPSVMPNVVYVNIPVLVFSAVGAVVALVSWRRHPRASLLTLVGCVSLAAAVLSGAWLIASANGHILELRNVEAISLQELNRRIIAVKFMGSLLQAAALGLLLGAVLVSRRHVEDTQPSLGM